MSITLKCIHPLVMSEIDLGKKFFLVVKSEVSDVSIKYEHLIDLN